jgi:uncharacterized LabA/DUF88 family protein
MSDTLIFIDGGFISKLSGHFGRGKYLLYDLIKFSENICKKEGMNCKQIFYYTAPPFQNETPTKKEEIKKEGYDKFIKKIKERKVIVREGRCQRLKIDKEFEYHQKAVDILVAMDLTNVPLNYPEIKRIILIATDSDFVPLITNLDKQGIKTILYTYYERKRDTKVSRSNYLIKSVYKYKLISMEDFNNAPLVKEKKKVALVEERKK